MWESLDSYVHSLAILTGHFSLAISTEYFSVPIFRGYVLTDYLHRILLSAYSQNTSRNHSEKSQGLVYNSVKNHTPLWPTNALHPNSIPKLRLLFPSLGLHPDTEKGRLSYG